MTDERMCTRHSDQGLSFWKVASTQDLPRGWLGQAWSIKSAQIKLQNECWGLQPWVNSRTQDSNTSSDTQLWP